MNTTTSLILALGLAAAGASTKVVPSKHERLCNKYASSKSAFMVGSNNAKFVHCMGGGDGMMLWDGK
jgi:hypothetical protein